MKTHVSPGRCGCFLGLALLLLWLPVVVIAGDATVPLLAPDSSVPLRTAVDAEDLQWLTYGDALWFGQTNVTSDGVDAAAVSLTDCAGAVLETSVTGPGMLSFRWKMIDPPNARGTVGFSLLLGGSIIRAGSWTAFNTNWNQVFIDDLPAGPLTIRWGFSGPCSWGTGTSFGYLDQILIATSTHFTSPAFALQPESQIAPVNDCATFRANAVASPVATYQWLRNGAPITGANSSTLLLTNIASSDFADYAVVAANDIGAVTSVVARLTEPARTLALALDTPGRVWRTATGCEGDGAGRWLPEFSITHDGIDAAVGRGLGCGPAALLETTVEGPGTVNFWWKTYTTESYFEDQDARFFILDANGGWETFTYLPGNADWTQTSLSFGPGRKILRWEAHGYCDGHDEWTTTWLDQVVITPGPTASDAGCSGSVDATFGNVRIEGDGYYQPNRISALIPQADGKVIIAGMFNRVQGNSRPGLARLNSNGTLDPTFPRLNEESIVNAIAVDGDGKLIVGGCMGEMNGVSIPHLVRLHADGQLDTTFQPAIPLLAVNAIVLLPDGKIVISAYVGSNGDDPPFTIVRLHANGSVDETFEFTAPGWAPIQPLVRQDDGAFIFNFINRCDANGTVDESFIPEVGELDISAVLPLPDGKLLMGGRKLYSESAVLRLNRNGSRDYTFAAPSLCADTSYGGSTEVLSFLPMPDGKIIVSGRFGFADRTWHPLLAQLNEDGSVDPLFQAETPFCAGCDDPEFVARTALAPGNKLMIAGLFTDLNGLSRGNVARLHLGADACDGVVSMATNELVVMENSAFAQVTILRHGNTNGAAAISYTTVDDSQWWQPSYASSPAFPGRDYVAQSGAIQFLPGETSRIISIPLLDNLQLQANRLFLVNLQASPGAVLGGPRTTRVVIVDDENSGKPGSLDLSFRPEIMAAPNTVAAVDRLGRILVAEGGTYVNSGACTIRRLHTSGARDASFKPVTVNGFVHALTTDSSNRVLVAGTFTRADSSDRAGIVRLNESGGIDSLFVAAPNGPVSRVLVLTAGKIMISGKFTSVNGTPRSSLARLHEDGETDLAFNPGTGPAPAQSYDDYSGSIYGLAEQADTRLLVCGAFDSFNGIARTGIARLNQDGTVDESFAVATGPDDSIEGVAVQADQKILLSGWMFHGRFHPDGSRDMEFNPQVSETINSIIPTVGGKVIVNGHLRLNPDGSLDTTFFAGTAAGSCYSAPPLHLPDGRLLVYGGLQQFNEVSYPGLAMLHGGLLPDGAGRIRFAASETGVTETDGGVEIPVRRDAGTMGSATVTFATADESAQAGVDYVAQSGVIVFTNNDAGEHVIRIPVINNTVAAGPRRFRVNLAAPTGGSILGVPSSISVDIFDDDVGVTLATNQFWQSESYNAGITVTRLGPPGRAFDVRVRVSGGTATAGVDFTAVETDVIFSATDMARWVNVSILQDAIAEPDESILIELLEPSDGVSLGIPSATLWIGDDDRPPCIMAARLTQTGFDFTMDLPLTQSLLLEASTNLVDWEILTYMYRGSIEGPLHFNDASATNQPFRFYRFTQP